MFSNTRVMYSPLSGTFTPVPLMAAKRIGSIAVMVLRLLANVRLNVADKSPAIFTRLRDKFISYPWFFMSPPFSVGRLVKPEVDGIFGSLVNKSEVCLEYKLISAVSKSLNNPIFHPRFQSITCSHRKSVKRILPGRIPMELMYLPSTLYTL